MAKERVYDFDLPYVLSSWYLSPAIWRLQHNNIWEKLPEEFRQRLETAKAEDRDVEITKEDCDKLDDETWTQVAEMADLEWSYKE